MSRALLWVLVTALVLVYPAVTLARGGPTFPKRTDCVHPANHDGAIDAVFGYFESEEQAAELRDRALAVGFEGTHLGWDGCGRVRVAVSGIPTLAVGRDFAKQARGVGFAVTLEQAG